MALPPMAIKWIFIWICGFGFRIVDYRVSGSWLEGRFSCCSMDLVTSKSCLYGSEFNNFFGSGAFWSRLRLKRGWSFGRVSPWYGLNWNRSLGSQFRARQRISIWSSFICREYPLIKLLATLRVIPFLIRNLLGWVIPRALKIGARLTYIIIFCFIIDCKL